MWSHRQAQQPQQQQLQGGCRQQQAAAEDPDSDGELLAQLLVDSDVDEGSAV